MLIYPTLELQYRYGVFECLYSGILFKRSTIFSAHIACLSCSVYKPSLFALLEVLLVLPYNPADWTFLSELFKIFILFSFVFSWTSKLKLWAGFPHMSRHFVLALSKWDIATSRQLAKDSLVGGSSVSGPPYSFSWNSASLKSLRLKSWRSCSRTYAVSEEIRKEDSWVLTFGSGLVSSSNFGASVGY